MRGAATRLRAAGNDPETRRAIKSAARQLFAERGVDGVSIREIVLLAGQKNGGSVHYHFGSKEALVRELVVDGARMIDDLRNAQLDRLTAGGATPTVRQIIEVLMNAGLMLGEDTYLRFVHNMQFNHREMFMDALGNQWNSGYQRCLVHLRALIPEVPALVLNQRLVFMEIYTTGVMAKREGSLNDPSRDHLFWKSPFILANFYDSIEQLLRGPPSAETQALLEARKPPGPRKTPKTRTNAGKE